MAGPRPGRGKRRVLVGFSLSYLVLLLVPLAMSVSAYINAADITRRQTISANMLLLENTSASIEGSLMEADQFASMLLGMRDVERVMKQAGNLGEALIYELNQLVQHLPELSDSNGLFSRYYLYSKSGDFVVEPLKGYVGLGRYYDSFFAQGDLDYRAWHDGVLAANKPSELLAAQTIVYPPGSGRALFYVKDFAYATRRLGKLVFYLDEARLLQMFSQAYRDGAAFACMLGRAGETLLLHGDAILAPASFAPPPGQGAGSFEANGLVLTYCRSAAYGWTLVIGTPNAVFLTRAREVLQPMLLGLALMMLIGIALAVLLMNSGRKPLGFLLDQLPEAQGHALFSSALEQVGKAVAQLSQSRDTLAMQLEKQKIELRSAAVSQLISGDASDAAGLQALLAHVGIRLNGGWHRGMYLRVQGGWQGAPEHADYRRMMILDLLKPYEANLQFLALQGANQFALLWTGLAREERQEHLTALLREVYTLLIGGFALEATFFIGGECEAPQDIARSFRSARRLMDASDPSRPTESWLAFADELPAKLSYDYTSKDRRALTNLAVAGDLAGVRALLGEIRLRNEASIAKHPFERQMLFVSMLDTLVSAGFDQPFDPRIVHSLSAMETERFFALLAGHYETLCARAAERKRRGACALLASVMAYIDQHYTDDDLSLTRVALHFGLTEKYLSAFIKDNAGVNFLAYVEGLRMRRAVELLAESELTVNEIAHSLGYVSDKSFRRAFRRVMGDSPSAHRGRAVRARRPGAPRGE